MMNTVPNKEEEIELIKKSIIKSNRKWKHSTRDEREKKISGIQTDIQETVTSVKENLKSEITKSMHQTSRNSEKHLKDQNYV